MSPKRTFAYFFIATIVVVNVFIWLSVFFHSSDMLYVSFLSVGEGHAILIQSPTGTSVLIDGGPDRSVLRALGGTLGPLNRTLAMVIETDTSASDVLGLSSVFARYRVHSLLTQRVPNTTTSARMLARASAHESGLLQKEMYTGMKIALGAGAYIEVLSSGAALSHAHVVMPVVLRIVYGNTSFMIVGTATQKAQKSLGTSLASTTLASEVLAIGHYGAPNSVDAQWLAAVHPRFAVISVGKNRYGYPSATTKTQLTNAHAQILTTQKATITFVSNGRTVLEK